VPFFHTTGMKLSLLLRFVADGISSDKNQGPAPCAAPAVRLDVFSGRQPETTADNCFELQIEKPLTEPRDWCFYPLPPGRSPHNDGCLAAIGYHLPRFTAP